MGNFTLIGLGEVVYVEGVSDWSYDDIADANRIKVRMDSDKVSSTADLPYAFPLLPKTLQSVPKEGEGVLVFSEEAGNPKSQRYYIGPIISQPQFQELCKYDKGRGDAMSLLSGKKPKIPSKDKTEDNSLPLTAISRAKDLTKGAFPYPTDIALIGRGQEDIVCKYRGTSDGATANTSEIDLRAGIRLELDNSDIKYLKGNVVFNSTDPAYIQVKYKQGGIAGLRETVYDGDIYKFESKEKRSANSIINVVADKINLISHKGGIGESIADADELVTEEEIDNIMAQLHRAVYGDKLIKLLELMCKAIFNHTHPFPMKTPCIVNELEQLQGVDFESILSPNVRLN